MFARAVLCSVDITKALPTFNDIKTAVEHLPDTNVRDSLLAQLTTANGDLQTLHENVAAWFDNSMDRVSGVYKRQVKQISFFIGLLLVIVIDADTLKVGRSLWNDASLRAGMVQTASSFLTSSTPADAAAEAGTTSTDQQTGSATTPRGKQKSKVDTRLEDAIQRVANAEHQLRPLPLGWSWRSIPSEVSWALLFNVLAKVIGLFLTTIAISLGAPFWFDLLSLFMRVRGTGQKPEKTSAT